jgi:hypothetical protein
MIVFKRILNTLKSLFQPYNMIATLLLSGAIVFLVWFSMGELALYNSMGKISFMIVYVLAYTMMPVAFLSALALVIMGIIKIFSLLKMRFCQRSLQH